MKTEECTGLVLPLEPKMSNSKRGSPVVSYEVDQPGQSCGQRPLCTGQLGPSVTEIPRDVFHHLL